MALTPEQQRLREGRLTASAVGCLMTGDTHKILDLWRLMVGDPAYEAPDWNAIWPIRLGEATEALNLEWYERRAGRRLSRIGEVVIHPEHNWAAATLDGFDDGLIGPIDAKHVGGFETMDTIVTRYTSQMMWQMDCTQTKRSALSIITGAKEPVVELVEWDSDYSTELWRRAEAFMRCVWDLTPPVPLPAVAAPIRAIKEYNFQTNNSWASFAVDWLENKSAAKKFVEATEEIKRLVPADAVKCTGHNIVVSRNKAGSLSIKEAK